MKDYKFSLMLPSAPIDSIINENFYDDDAKAYANYANTLTHKIIDDSNPNQLIYEFYSNNYNDLVSLRHKYLRPDDEYGYTPDELPIHEF